MHTENFIAVAPTATPAADDPNKEISECFKNERFAMLVESRYRFGVVTGVVRKNQHIPSTNTYWIRRPKFDDCGFLSLAKRTVCRQWISKHTRALVADSEGIINLTSKLSNTTRSQNAPLQWCASIVPRGASVSKKLSVREAV